MNLSVWCAICDEEFIAEEGTNGECPYCGESYHWEEIEKDCLLLPVFDNDFV